MHARRHQTRDMRHINQKIRARVPGNSRQSLKINLARICRPAGNQKPWPQVARLLCNRVVIQ